MKVFYIECTEEELRANRGIMDAVVDAVSGMLNGIYGTITPAAEDDEDEQQEQETEQDV